VKSNEGVPPVFGVPNYRNRVVVSNIEPVEVNKWSYERLLGYRIFCCESEFIAWKCQGFMKLSTIYLFASTVQKLQKIMLELKFKA
jgi:hypothetical protein